MKHAYLLITAASVAFSSPALAEDIKSTNPPGADAAAAKPDSDAVTTGVARARDRLDSATSTSAVKESEIQDIGARSFAEILRNIPGLRVEAAGGEGNANISIRGLPLSQSGSKFMQLQEDGLPVLEFGDITSASSDMFMRADLNVGQIEAIRGGSASTFASNSPGGVINLIDKTGDVQGGAIQAGTGLDYGEYRVDFDYGQKISDTWRFHIGGFYREGEGPRSTGYSDAYKGGQLKFNITKEFDGGYIRLYAKLLDDRSPAYTQAPVAVSGTDANPHYSDLPGFSIQNDSLYSRNVTSQTVMNANNQLISNDIHDGMHAKEKTIGLEGQFEVSGWTVMDKFRYSDVSGNDTQYFAVTAGPAANMGGWLAGGPSVQTYATGPNAGQAFSATGNGILVPTVVMDTPLSLNYVVNDLRASRVWKIGKGELTTTVGFYKSDQNITEAWLYTSVLMDAVGGGNNNLINVATPGGTAITQGGVIAYSANLFGGAVRRSYDVDYGVNAPFGSLNYHVGRLAIGGSIRYDMDTANGRVWDGAATGSDSITYDVNGNGAISLPETHVAVLPLSTPYPVNYKLHYLSYSAGVNFHIIEPLSVFARYSLGGRENADRMLETPAINLFTGALVDSSAAVDTVRQTEFGAKFRKAGLTLNATAFLADATDHNYQLNNKYHAYGVEFEGGYRWGAFSIIAGATLTHARISQDFYTPSETGNTPHHQSPIVFQATPQYNNEHFTIGANIVGTGSSYASDSDQLKMSGYTVVSPFVQYRPVPRVLVSLNCNNLFNVIGLTEVEQATMAGSGGVVTGRAINGRTISSSVRLNF